LLTGIGKEILNDSAAAGGFWNVEERFVRLPAVLHRQVPALRAGPLADDDLDAIVLHVERLAPTLNAIAQDGDRLAAEDAPDLLRRIIRTLDHCLHAVPDLDLPHE